MGSGPTCSIICESLVRSGRLTAIASPSSPSSGLRTQPRAKGSSLPPRAETPTFHVGAPRSAYRPDVDQRRKPIRDRDWRPTALASGSCAATKPALSTWPILLTRASPPSARRPVQLPRLGRCRRAAGLRSPSTPAARSRENVGISPAARCPLPQPRARRSGRRPRPDADHFLRNASDVPTVVAQGIEALVVGDVSTTLSILVVVYARPECRRSDPCAA